MFGQLREKKKPMRRIIDLSFGIYPEMPDFMSNPRVSFATVATIKSVGYNSTKITMCSHSGTHIDAPSHFIENGLTVDSLPLDRCVGKAMVVDMSYKKDKRQIDINDFAKWEGKIVEGTRVLIRTNW